MAPSKVKSGTVTINRSFTIATYDYIQEYSNSNNRITLMYSLDKNWQNPNKVAISLSESHNDLILIRGDGYQTYLPRRLLEPFRIILHLDEKLNALSRMDKIKVHQENK